MKRRVNVLWAGALAMAVLLCGEEKKGETPDGEIADVKEEMGMDSCFGLKGLERLEGEALRQKPDEVLK